MEVEEEDLEMPPPAEPPKDDRALSAQAAGRLVAGARGPRAAAAPVIPAYTPENETKSKQIEMIISTVFFNLPENLPQNLPEKPESTDQHSLKVLRKVLRKA